MASKEKIMMNARGSLGSCGLLVGRVSSLYKLSRRCQKLRNKLICPTPQLVLVDTRGGRLRKRKKTRKLAPGVEPGIRVWPHSKPVYLTAVLRQLWSCLENLNTLRMLSQGTVKKKEEGPGHGHKAHGEVPESVQKAIESARRQHAGSTRGARAAYTPNSQPELCSLWEYLFL
jgi:hypothetical protein